MSNERDAEKNNDLPTLGCTHDGTVIDLYSSHGGWAEWCWACGAAQGSDWQSKGWMLAGSDPSSVDVIF